MYFNPKFIVFNIILTAATLARRAWLAFFNHPYQKINAYGNNGRDKKHYTQYKHPFFLLGWFHGIGGFGFFYLHSTLLC